MQQDTQTLKPLMEHPGKALTLFPVDSLASHTATPESERETTTTVRSGLKCLELFGKFNRPGLLGKTLLASSAWTAGVYSTALSLTWKMQAIRQKHLLFRLAVSVRPISGTDFGLLHTPTAVMMEGRTAESLAKRTEYRQSIGRKTVPPGNLSEQLAALLPTPAANPPGWKNRQPVDKNGNLPETHNERWYDAETGRLMQKGLEQVLTLLPTPTAGSMDKDNSKSAYMSRSKSSCTGKRMEQEMVAIGENTGYKLQPEFVEWMMGFPEGWTEVSD